MRQLSTREIVLACVLGTSILFLVWWNFIRGDAVLPGAGAGGDEQAAGAIPGASVPLLALDRHTAAPELHDHVRNLFAYSKSPEEIADEQRRAEELRRMQELAEQRRREEQERLAREAAAAAERAKNTQVVPREAPPPTLTLKLVGLMGPPKDKIVVLADPRPGGEIFLARQGGVIANDFKVLDIQYDTVTIGYVNPKWEQLKRTLKLGS